MRKNNKLKRIYHFEGRITRRDGYYIYRDVSRTVMVTIIEDQITRSDDAWTDMSPMGPRLRDKGCVTLGKTCIIILDITFHCIVHTYD